MRLVKLRLQRDPLITLLLVIVTLLLGCGNGKVRHIHAVVSGRPQTMDVINLSDLVYTQESYKIALFVFARIKIL